MPTKPRLPMTFDTAKAFATKHPGVEEGTSYRTRALKVGKTLLARLKEDGVTLVLSIEMDVREMLIEGAPEAFFITDHYLHAPWVLVRLSHVDPAQLETLIDDAVARLSPAIRPRVPSKSRRTGRR